MTTEEKAKAYLEALGKAKDLLEQISTEIKESEDETIRKSLLAYIKGESKRLDTQKWIAWLEKQKEASKAIEAVEKIDKYIDEHLANAHDMKDTNPDKKYYRGWDDALGKIAGILQDVYSEDKQKEQEEPQVYKTRDGETITYSETDGYKVCDEKQKEQKSEWSEEDENNIGKLHRLLVICQSEKKFIPTSEYEKLDK